MKTNIKINAVQKESSVCSFHLMDVCCVFSQDEFWHKYVGEYATILGFSLVLMVK